MLSKILNFLSADIEVEVSADRFVFKRADITKTFKTKVYVSNDSKKPKILGVGDETTITQSNTCIELFKDSKDGLFPNNPKSQFLDAFFHQAFYLITKRTAMVRPRVVFKNSKSLKGILCGYQELILSQSAEKGGVRECVFES